MGILEVKTGQFSDIADWWEEEAKPNIKDFCIAFSAQRNLRRMDSKEDTQGYVVRSRYQNNASEETASLFHANKEMKNAAKNNIQSLKIGNDVSAYKSTIEEEITHFFQALFNGHHGTNLEDTGEPFKADNTDLDLFLQDLSALPDNARDNLVKEIKIEELEEIVGHTA